MARGMISRKGEANDTIVAPATPTGRSGLAVVRLSGSEAWRIIKEATGRRTALEERRAVVASYFGGSGELLDRVVFTAYRAPHSYTGQDVVEISCHGNPLIVERIVRDCIERGARLAEPGEFTLRAFLHGKLDVVQAEAVRDLIEGRTWEQVRAAQGGLCGEFRAQLEAVKERLVDVVIQLETRLEFVEEEVCPQEDSELLAKLDWVMERLQDWVLSYDRARVVRDGFKVVLAGLPNVGKSSLFNRLLGEDRAIVTEEPGTTRDTLREWRDVQGVPVCLVDTAGMRTSGNEVERLGVDRARKEVEGAQAVLLVVDATCVPTEEVAELWTGLEGRRRLLVINKIDLGGGEDWLQRFPVGEESACLVSAREGTGVRAVWDWLEEVVREDAGGQWGGVLLLNERQRACVESAGRYVLAGRQNLEGGRGDELVVEELRKALRALGELVGETTPEDVLRGIFASFCIGK